jgi:hypothetical protein
VLRNPTGRQLWLWLIAKDSSHHLLHALQLLLEAQMRKSLQSKTTQANARHLNMRNVPEDLYWLCKARAAESHMTLTDYVLAALRRVVSEAPGRSKKSA